MPRQHIVFKNLSKRRFQKPANTSRLSKHLRQKPSTQAVFQNALFQKPFKNLQKPFKNLSKPFFFSKSFHKPFKNLSKPFRNHFKTQVRQHWTCIIFTNAIGPESVKCDLPLPVDAFEKAQLETSSDVSTVLLCDVMRRDGVHGSLGRVPG